jgi:hypothetical protein
MPPFSVLILFNVLLFEFYIPGLGKKIDALAKKRGFSDVGLWKKSIVNHMYWVAASTPTGDPETMVAKWQSINNHIANIHQHRDNQLYPQCSHGPLVGAAGDKEWLRPGINCT